MALGQWSHHCDYLGHDDLFLYSSSVSSCHLFSISSASVRSIPFLSFIEPIFTWNVPLVSLIFLKRYLVFPILLFSSISLHWSLRKAFLSPLSIYLSSIPRPYLSWEKEIFPPPAPQGFSCGSAAKESTCNAADLGSIPGLERSPGEGKGYALQYSGLENSMDCIVHGVTKSLTRLSDIHFLPAP